MPEGPNRQARELPRRRRRSDPPWMLQPRQTNPQSETRRESKRVEKALSKSMPADSARKIAEGIRHKQGGSNRGKDLMSEAEARQRVRGANRTGRKSVKNRKGVVITNTRTRGLIIGDKGINTRPKIGAGRNTRKKK